MARHAQPEVQTSNAHLSLTSSASIDSPVSEGGRVAQFRIKFRAWLSSTPSKTEVGETWFGKPFWLVEGVPIWQTMCRPERIHSDTDQFGHISHPDYVDIDNINLIESMHGLDNILGYQLFQFSIEDLIRTGTLDGSTSKSVDLLRRGTVSSPIRCSAIGEPGAKARIVTIGEDSLTEFLQPFSHQLLGMLRNHPSATSGLTFGWQLFEWVKALRNTSPCFGEKMYSLSSDLKTATDFCQHGYSAAMLRGFFISLS